MKPEDSITQVMATFMPLMARGANIVQDVTGKVLGDAASRWLQLDSREEVDFQRNPHEDSRAQPGPQRLDIGGAGDIRAGNNSATISGARVATRGGSYYQGDNITTNIIKSCTGRMIMLTVIAVAICAGLVMKSGGALNSLGGGLDAGSACQHFPHFPQAGQVWAAGAGWHHPASGPWQSWRPGPVRMDFPGGHDHWCRP